MRKQEMNYWIVKGKRKSEFGFENDFEKDTLGPAGP
jgi:hypothetical protein